MSIVRYSCGVRLHKGIELETEYIKVQWKCECIVLEAWNVMNAH